MPDTTFGDGGWTPDRLDTLSGKTTTSGTGFEAARILLSKGAKVVMLNRNEEKSKAAIEKLKEELGDGIDVHFVEMDLSILKSVRKAAEYILSTETRIDALICYAAIAQVPEQRLTEDGFGT